MNGYSFALACPLCGGALRHVTGGTEAGTYAQAVSRCDACRAEWHVAVSLRRVPNFRATERVRRSRERRPSRCVTRCRPT